MRGPTVPRWVLWLLATVAVISAVIGRWLESHDVAWMAVHPYDVNLLSGITGFAFSAFFVGVVLQRITFNFYRKRWEYVTASLVTPLVNKTLRVLSLLIQGADMRLGRDVAAVADDQLRYDGNPLTAHPAGVSNIITGIKSVLKILKENEQHLIPRMLLCVR
jgi:hypothetical protein